MVPNASCQVREPSANLKIRSKVAVMLEATTWGKRMRNSLAGTIGNALERYSVPAA